jgi:hypothetical protein
MNMIKRLDFVFIICLLFVFWGSPGNFIFCDSENMLSNGDFSKGTSGWKLATFTGGQADYAVQKGELLVRIKNAGQEAHSVIINQLGLKIQKGKAYLVNFKARTASGSKKIFVKVGLAREPWTAYSGYESFTLDSSNKEYTLEFVMNQTTDSNAYLEFHLGADPGDVFLDDVILKQAYSGSVHALIDFSDSGEPCSTRAFGILLSMSENWPPDKYILALKPSLIRYGNFSLYERAKKLKARFMLLLFGEYPDIYLGGRLDKKGNWPGDNNKWESWDAYVLKVARQAKQQGYTDVIWEVWNEPDLDIFWKRSFNQFLLTYEHTVKTIRQVLPGALVTGPSFALYDEGKINDFLRFAKEHGVLPDIINWHEIPNAPDGISERVDKIRSYLKNNNINIDRFMFPEITGPDFQFSPGNAVSFMANIHRARVEASAKSCWPDTALTDCPENCFTDTLDGLLHPLSGEPRSTWWCYKKYAEMSGILLSFTTLDKNIALDGIASYDASAKQARILLGRTQSNNVLKGRAKTGKAQDIVLEIRNIPEKLIQADEIRLIAKKIPDSGPNVLKEPLLMIDSAKRVNTGSLKISLPGMGTEDVYYLVLSNPQNKISASEEDFSTDYENYYLQRAFNNRIFWYIATDREAGGESTGVLEIKTETINGKEAEALTMSGSLSKKSQNPYVIFGTTMDILAKKLHKAKGVRFKIVGSGQVYRMEFATSGVKDYCYHGHTFTAEQNQVKEITVYFDKLEQRSWGKKVPFDKSTINAVNFVFDGGIVQVGLPFRLKIFDFEVLDK